MNPIQIKVAKVGSAVITVCVDAGSTVAEALAIAGLSLSSAESLKVGGSTVDGTTVLSADTLITILPKIKGGKF